MPLLVGREIHFLCNFLRNISALRGDVNTGFSANKEFGRRYFTIVLCAIRYALLHSSLRHALCPMCHQTGKSFHINRHNIDIFAWPLFPIKCISFKILSNC